MMTDRELLELAAKAAGYTLSEVADMIWSDEEADFTYWNPLTDDGDALRLSVRLSICVQPFTESMRPDVFCLGMNHIGTECIEHFDQHDEDSVAATRRAIVRAAAEIGKAMKGEPHGQNTP